MALMRVAFIVKENREKARNGERKEWKRVVGGGGRGGGVRGNSQSEY